MNRIKMKNVWAEKEAVSPVIGVILLVAITVVLASVLYLWVSAMVVTSKSTPTGGADVRYEDPYVIVTVTSMSEGKPINMVSYQMLSSVGVVKIDPTEEPISGTLLDIYNVNLTGEDVYISFSDTDSNGKLNPGDTIQIKNSVVASGDILRIGYSKTGGEIFKNTLM